MKENNKKKNSFVLVLGILILCIITTCVVGTTLAKYTTSDRTKDEARIAKWGVSISMEGDPLFKNEYSTTGGVLVVKSTSSDKNVVAPGTSSGTNGSAIFTITGTPEVATRVKIDLSDVQDVYLKSGTYTLNGKQFNLATTYNPVKFTLKQLFSNKEVVLVEGTLSQIKKFLDDEYNNLGIDGNKDNLYNGREYSPNTTLDATFELSWEWAFEGENTNDKADTYLGNLMANVNPDNLDLTSYSVNVGYSLEVNVTQIN